MEKKQKKIVIDAGTLKRAKRAQWRQHRGDRCIICNGDFDTCPHPLVMVDEVIAICRRGAQYDVRL